MSRGKRGEEVWENRKLGYLGYLGNLGYLGYLGNSDIGILGYWGPRETLFGFVT
jgi:hypothetical protein